MNAASQESCIAFTVVNFTTNEDLRQAEETKIACHVVAVITGLLVNGRKPKEDEDRYRWNAFPYKSRRFSSLSYKHIESREQRSFSL